MKKFVFYLASVMLLLLFVSAPLMAVSSNSSDVVTAVKPDEVVVAEALLSRLNEIKAMDIKALPGYEKKQLRKEVKAIKSELKALNQGVYLSVGAIIIIILLVILLL